MKMDFDSFGEAADKLKSAAETGKDVAAKADTLTSKYKWPIMIGLALIVLFGWFGCAGAAELSVYRLCTGGKSGQYFHAGADIAAQAKGRVVVQVVETKGSWDNLERISRGECDGAIVQADAFTLFQQKNPLSKMELELSRTLYSEVAHFVCNVGSKVKSASDLKPSHKVMIGGAGSGTWVSWENWQKLNKNLNAVQTLPEGGTRALAKVVSGDADCMLYISGISSQAMKEVDKDSKNDKGEVQIGLVSLEGAGLDKLTDKKGRKIYRVDTIPGGTYPNILPKGWLGGSKGLDTVVVDAQIVTSTAFIESNGDVYDSFLKAAANAVKVIGERMGKGK